MLKASPFFLCVLSFVCCISCHNKYDESVELSLELSGNNRRELEFVLEHYKSQGKDSLKYKAAKFLIANMKNHYSSYQTTNTPDYIKSSFSKVHALTKSYFYNSDNQITPNDSLIFEDSIAKIASHILDLKTEVTQFSGVFPDLMYIKPNWIIEHIDNAFKVWNISPFAKGMSYDEFCRTLLNYRFNHEALDVSSKIYKEYFYDIIHHNNPDTIVSVVREFNKYTHYADIFELDGKFHADIFELDGKFLGEIGIYDILQFRKYTCDRNSEWSARVLNSCGIPTFKDITPIWQDRGEGHGWVSVRSKSGRYYPFSPMWQELDDTTYFSRTYFSRVSKVYRRSFEIQDGPNVEKSGKANVPILFWTPFIKDVTDIYHRVFDISIPIIEDTQNIADAYLCIFTSKGWRPAGWGKVNNEEHKVHFKKVPQNVTFVVSVYQNHMTIPISMPFFVNSNGQVIEIIPNYDKLENVTITRKFYKKEKFVQMAKDMQGVVIQGANTRNFSDAKDLYTFQWRDLSNLVVKSINLKNKKTYRFLRLKANDSKKINLAILEVYSGENYSFQNDSVVSVPFVLPGEINESRVQSYYKVPVKAVSDTYNYKEIFDGDMETFVTTKSLEIDLGRKVDIKQIRIAPRNANNHVVAGDKYELMYYDKRWVSAGVKSTDVNYLIYKDIPSGTLLWLKNLDRGKEEQSFIIHGKQQYFVNHDDISNIVQITSTRTNQIMDR